MRALISPASILVLGLLVLPVPAQTLLRYKLKEGDTIDYINEGTWKNLTSSSKNKNVGITRHYTEMRWHVLKIDKAGNAEIKQTFTRVKMSLGDAIRVDSEDRKQLKDPDFLKVLTPALDAIKSLEVSFTLTSVGQVKDVKVPKDLFKKAGILLDLSPYSGKDAASFQKMIQENHAIVLPQAAVRKGDTWKWKLETVEDQNPQLRRFSVYESAGEITYMYEGTVIRAGKTLHKIKVTPNIKVHVSRPTLIVDKLVPIITDVKVIGTGTKGEVLFDADNGRVVSAANELRTEESSVSHIRAANVEVSSIVHSSIARQKGFEELRIDIDEGNAGLLLQKAEAVEVSSRLLARMRCEELIQKYPNTKAAAAAKKLLAKLLKTK